MYINFYGNNLNKAVSVPVQAYKINTFYKREKGDNLDVLGNTISEILKVGEKIDVHRICYQLGINPKYEKLVEKEINELKDKKIIECDKNLVVTQVNKEEIIQEKFYVFYDILNNVMLDCIVEEYEFERYRKLINIKEDNVYKLGKANNKVVLDNYELCAKIQNLITESNKVCGKIDANEDENSRKLNKIPFHEIELDIVENIDKPIAADFLIAISRNMDYMMSKSKYKVNIRDPFTFEDSSKYIDDYIRDRVENNFKVEELIEDDFGLKEMKRAYTDAEKIIKEKYKNILRNEDEEKELTDLIRLKKLLSANIDTDIDIRINNINNIVKSRMRDIVYKFNESTIDTKNVNIKKLLEKDEKIEEISDIKIVGIATNGNIKRIRENKQIISVLDQGSIKDYLKCIYVSEKFTNKKENEYERKISNIFKERKLVECLDDFLRYRNSTVHNIEKGKYYEEEYDLQILYKERLEEVVDILIGDLIYFLEKTNDL